MAVCSCESGIFNSGLPSCVGSFGKIVKLIFVAQTANDGTDNFIPCNTVVDAAYVTAKLNEADPSKRWYPSDDLVGVVQETADNVTEAIGGINYNVEAGASTFLGQFIGKASSNPQYLQFLKSLECGTLMYFAVDVNGNLVGELIGTALYGFRIQPNTVSSKFIFGTDTTIAKNQVAFTLSPLVLQERISVLLKNDGLTADLLGAKGLLDVVLSAPGTPVTLDWLEVTAKLLWKKSGCTSIDYVGSSSEDVSDWELYNYSTLASITITSVEYLGDAQYKLNFAAQTSGDEIGVKLSKNGFISNELKTTI